MALVRQADGLNSETCRKDPVQSRRCPTPLKMAQHTTARFFTGAHRDFPRDNLANTTKPKLTTFNITFHLFAVLRSRAFRSDDHGSQVTGRFARFDHAGDFLV